LWWWWKPSTTVEKVIRDWDAGFSKSREQNIFEAGKKLTEKKVAHN